MSCSRSILNACSKGKLFHFQKPTQLKPGLEGFLLFISSLFIGKGENNQRSHFVKRESKVFFQFSNFVVWGRSLVEAFWKDDAKEALLEDNKVAVFGFVCFSLLWLWFFFAFVAVIFFRFCGCDWVFCSCGSDLFFALNSYGCDFFRSCGCDCRSLSNPITKLPP